MMNIRLQQLLLARLHACFFKEVRLRRVKRVIGDPAVSARGRDVFSREI